MLPFPIQFILMLINIFVPDPIPFLDEIIMGAGVISKLYWLENIGDHISDFFKKHKFLSFLIGLAFLYAVSQLF